MPAPLPRPIPAPAARQVLPLAVSLLVAPGSQPALTITLEPEALGRVEVRLARGEGGAAALRLVAERPETLALLARDRAELHQGLAASGLALPPENLSFALSGEAGGEAGGGDRRGPPARGGGRAATATAEAEGERPLLLSLIDLRV
ncbi:MAG: flagellar hook-length control protein FliK [Rhodovarius sp.]|nr:flagellar hook-length control protein FliK [Rhodovarius sp.]